MKRRAKKQKQQQQQPPAQRAKKSKKRSKGGAESLEERMQRLQGGHFRQINEMLYTSTGAAAAAAFRDDPALFGAYHAGYALQVAQWPEDPLDAVIAAVRAEGAKKRADEDRSSPLRVADLGCGVARMAAELDPARFAVHSFDLVAANERVTACNIAHVPLAAASVDAAAFCLSLMGTDHAAFVAEAHRILVPGGLLLVAEAKSRIGSVQVFVRGMELMGFERAAAAAAAAAAADEDANTMFILFAFRKSRTRIPNVAGAAPKLALKPCLYKRR